MREVARRRGTGAFFAGASSLVSGHVFAQDESDDELELPGEDVDTGWVAREVAGFARSLQTEGRSEVGAEVAGGRWRLTAERDDGTFASRIWLTVSTLLFGLSLLPECPLGAQDDEAPFLLDFQGPSGVLSGSPGEVLEAVFFLTLTPPDSQHHTCGWSVGLTADDAEIHCIWVRPSENSCAPAIPTDASELLERIESFFTAAALTSHGRGDCENRRAAVSATALGFEQPLFLPAGEPSTIAAISVRFSVGADPYEAVLRYVDGCGRSDPIINRIAVCPPDSDALAITPLTNRHTVVIVPDFPFRRGDCNDDGAVDISDAVATLEFLFLGEGDPGCDDACDSNDDGAVDISDAINTLGATFLGERRIPPPGVKSCGADPTEDDAGCLRYEECP